MKATHFHGDATRLVKQRAYEPSPGGGLRLAPPVPTRLGAGGIFTTVEDLARWDQNYHDGLVGGGIANQTDHDTRQLEQRPAAGICVRSRGIYLRAQ